MSKSTKGEKTTFFSEDDLFDALTKSGFEFLGKSIDEFKKSTKFSTINFATAIELFLKAKLMREHWSLLLDKPDQANKQKFFSGDAKTATHGQTMDRLHTIASVSIPQNYKEIFGTIFCASQQDGALCTHRRRWSQKRERAKSNRSRAVLRMASFTNPAKRMA